MNYEALVSVPEAATYLAVSATTIRRLVKAGQLTARRVGRQLRFEPAVLLEYSGPVETLVPSGGFDFAAAIAGVRYIGGA